MSGQYMVGNAVPTTKTLQFAPRPVSRDDVMYLLRTARLAPSARNTQIWHFTVIADPAPIRSAATVAHSNSLADAPVLIVAQGKPAFFKQLQHEQPFLMIDVPIAMTHLSLAARERGLTLEWVFDGDETALRDTLKLSSNLRVVALGFLGYAGRAEDLPQTERPGVLHNKTKP